MDDDKWDKKNMMQGSVMIISAFRMVVSVIQKAQTAVSTAQRFRSRASAAAVAFDLHSFLRVASGRSG